MDITKVLLVTQIAIQIIFIVLVLILIIKDRRKEISADALDALKDTIVESGKLSDEFSKQIHEKARILSELMQSLDERIKHAESVKTGLENLTQRTSEQRTYRKEDVLKLRKGGFEPVDISQMTGIPVGEIQLMLKVAEGE